MRKTVDYTVQCPYYRKEHRQSIFCEGLAEDMTLQLTFPRQGGQLDHKRSYCCGVWHACPVAAAQNRRYDYTP